jgi:outer membrane protein
MLSFPCRPPGFPWFVLVWLFVAQAGVLPAAAQPDEKSNPSPVAQDLAGFPRVSGTVSADSVVQLGLQHSFEIAMTRARLRMQAAETDEARSASRPQLSLNGYGMRNTMPMIYQSAPGVMPNFIQLYDRPGALSASVMLMMPLYTGGALEHQLQAAEQAEKAAIAKTALALRETARQVRLAYFKVQESRASAQVLLWQRKQNEEMERIAQEQLKAGKVAPFVRLRAQAEVAATQQKQNDLEAELTEREVTLKTAMGVSVDSEFAYPDVEEAPRPPAPLMDLVKLSLSERSDLVAARYAVEQGDRLVAAAVSEYSPKAYLVGMGESTRTNPFGPTMSETGYSVGIVLSFPLFDGGMREAREERARASFEENQLKLRQLELEATGQVTSARARLLASLQNFDLSRVELAKAEEDWRIAHLRQAAGRSLYVETLDALTALARARNNQLRALYSARLADADLVYATGRY